MSWRRKRIPRMTCAESAAVCAGAAPGVSTASSAVTSQRFKGETLWYGELAEALEQLPELDGAEILEAAKHVLLGAFHEDPAGGAGGFVGDEMHFAPRGQLTGNG